MTHRCAEMSLRLHFKSTHVHLRYCKRLLSHIRSSMLHSLWLPAPKARWPRTTWMFSKISGRNKCASWLRLWMTSLLWMISFLCQVWASTNSSQTDWLKQMFHMLLIFAWSEWVIDCCLLVFSGTKFSQKISMEAWCEKQNYYLVNKK